MNVWPKKVEITERKGNQEVHAVVSDWGPFDDADFDQDRLEDEEFDRYTEILDEIRTKVELHHQRGLGQFPFSVLARSWLKELADVGLHEVDALNATNRTWIRETLAL